MSETVEKYVDTEGKDRDKSNGRFVAGNTAAKGKTGKRHKIQQMQLDYIEKRIEEGYAYYEAISKMAHDKTLPPEVQLKALKIENDFINNPASLTGIIEDDEDYTGEELKDSILLILKRGASARVDKINEENEKGE